MQGYVRYEDFGAFGDGIHNDFFAIKAAHDYANKNGLPVKCEPCATYLIGNKEKDGVASSIEIMTDTDWHGSTFILDDTDTSWVPDGKDKNYCTNPFHIKSSYEPVALSEKAVNALNKRGGIHGADIDKIETDLGYPAMLIIRNDDKKVFIRYGGNANDGNPQFELVLVDKDGNIDPATKPFMFDFDKITGITAYRADDVPIVVENAKFISRASRVCLDNVNHYILSGILITRSNTTVKNLVHSIVGEIPKYAVVDKDSNILEGYVCDPNTRTVRDPLGNTVTDGHAKGYLGHAYDGFIQVLTANHILVENVTFQARVYYMQGSYDLSCEIANDIVFKNCDQSNFFEDPKSATPRASSMGRCWGVGGTNFCKNITYDTCRLTRFDAHAGLVNGKIINSEIAATRLTGAGEMLIENTRLYAVSRVFVSLREDYGATWRGTITVKNCEYLDVCNKSYFASAISCASPNHDFGYPVHFPNLIIDNLKVENPKPEIELVYEMKCDPQSTFYYRSVYDPALSKGGELCLNGKPNVSPQTPPEFIKVINNEDNGYKFILRETEFFKNTYISGVKIIKQGKNRGI